MTRGAAVAASARPSFALMLRDSRFRRWQRRLVETKAFLSHQTDPGYGNCPVPPALDGEDGVLGTGRGEVFLIEADRPVTVYSKYPYAGTNATASASLLIPSHAW